jgi:hypothetical protein
MYFNAEHRAKIGRGATLLGIGLAKKLLIADQLAPFVERGYAAAANIALDPGSSTPIVRRRRGVAPPSTST